MIRAAVLVFVTGCTTQKVGLGRQGLVSDLSQPWIMHVIASGYNGADGVHMADVDGDGLRDVVSGWEQGGKVTVSYNPGDGSSPWPTTVIAQNIYGLEDAIFADVDSDGRVDVISACESCKKITVHFNDADGWTSVIVTASSGLQRWMKVEFADVTGDGVKDIISGGKVDPASIGYFTSQTPRIGSSWAYTSISPASWIMGLEAHDVDGDGDKDIVASDRDYIHTTPPNYSYRGTKWLENPSWASHSIGTVVGNHRFFDVADLDKDELIDIVDGRSTSTYNLLLWKRNIGLWQNWVENAIPMPANVGLYQAARVADIDRDGVNDIVLSFSDAVGALSGVVWLKGPSWQRGEISGEPGVKFDNLELDDVDGDCDLDVVTSEQSEQLGVVWYENPNAPSCGG